MLWQGFRNATVIGYCARPQLAMKGTSVVGVEGFDQLTQYWHGLMAQADGQVPPRAMFNPADIVPLLPNIYLLERLSADHIDIRLCGTALDEITGVSITGMNYLAICPQEDRDVYREVMHNTLAVPCGAILEREVTFENGKVFHVRSQGFPLADGQGIPRFSIGLMLPLAVMRVTDMENGPVLRSVLKRLDYIDLGFGVPQNAVTLHGN